VTDARRGEGVEEKETARTESFSDAVFAIAMTLLVLDLVVPRIRDGTTGELAAALGAQVVPLFVLVLSFATIYIMWMNHHALFRRIRHVDGRVLYSNGLLLLLVTICPFPTALLAEYLGHEGDRLAAAVYACYFALVNVAYNLLIESIARAPHRERHGLDDASVHVSRRNLRFGFVAYALAALASLWSAWLTVAICILLWGFWARTPFHLFSARERAG
jgi:uncharacterized membrane protein